MDWPTIETARWAQLFGLRSVAMAKDGLLATFLDGESVALTAQQLWNDAPFQFDQGSGQRFGSAVSPAPALTDMRAEADRLLLSFSDGTELAFPLSFLTALARPSQTGRATVLWPLANGLRRFSARDYFQNSAIRRRALAAVLRDGACLLHDLEPRDGALEDVVAAFGVVRPTNYGKVFDVRPEERATNLAYTRSGLAPHTDNPYREVPPALQLLHCLNAPQSGGQTILVDGWAAVERLRRENPNAFALLASHPVRFAWRDPSTVLETRACVISLDNSGRVVGLRVNDRALAPLDLPPDRREAWRTAYAALQRILEDPIYRQEFMLAPGDAMILDNQRILHGRTALTQGGRWLQGCYADKDGLTGSLSLLETEETLKRASEALAPLRGPAGDEHYGEDVTLRAHSLQTAMLASADNQPAEIVAAALLHDAGWTFEDKAHEIRGADFAAQRFGDSVGDPIRLHVAAKRYLVAVDPAYEHQLSESSKRTLAMQGGPMNAEERLAFEQQPGFAAAIALRRLDDRAKDSAAWTLPLDAYCPMLRDLALTALRKEDERV